MKGIRKRSSRGRPRKKSTTRVTVDYPKDQHRRLKSRAALAGMTLQEYIRTRTLLEEDVSDREIKPIIRRIIEENEEILKRLADK